MHTARTTKGPGAPHQRCLPLLALFAVSCTTVHSLGADPQDAGQIPGPTRLDAGPPPAEDGGTRDPGAIDAGAFDAGAFDAGTDSGPRTDCEIGGCSGTVCSDEPGVVSSCEFRPEYACYSDAICERQPGGDCGWTQTPESEECFGPFLASECFVGGCNSTICSEIFSSAGPCVARPEDACFELARCEPQATGGCGWTPNPEFRACVESARNP